jgi:hypothetical protein
MTGRQGLVSFSRVQVAHPTPSTMHVDLLNPVLFIFSACPNF